MERFSFFVIFENGHSAVDWLYFYEFNTKKTAKFSFSKNHRDLKNWFFGENLLQRTIAKKKTFWEIFFSLSNFSLLSPLNGQNGPWRGQSKNKLFWVTLNFIAFKLTEEEILFQVQPLKICSDPLRPCAKWKSNRSKWNFGFGVPLQWHEKCLIFFFKNHFTLLVSCSVLYCSVV